MSKDNKKIIEILGNPDSIVIDWLISNICNYNCTYCPTDSKDGSQKWPDIDATKQFITKLKDSNLEKEFRYILLGGEVTIWKQFPEFVQMLRDVTPRNKIRLVTNGSPSKSFWKKYGILFDSIQFSLHVTNEKFDIEKAITSINECSCQDNSVFIMAPPYNWEVVLKSYDYALKNLTNYRSLVAKPIDNRALVNVNNLLNYTDEQKNWIKQSRIFSGKVNTPSFVRIKAKYSDGTIETVDPMQFIITKTNTWKNWKCSIGVEKLTLHYNGDVTKGSACSLGGIVGNWKTGEFNNISSEWVECIYDNCFCAADISVSKKL